MAYKFETLLKRNGFPADGPSTSIKRKIKDFRDLEIKIQSAKTTLPTLKKQAEKVELQNEIKEAEDALPAMDADICDSINRFLKNKDVYAANSERLAASRAAKKAAPPAEAKTETKEETPPAKHEDNTPPVNNTPEQKPAEPAKPEKTESPAKKTESNAPTEKKKSGAWGWVLGAVGIIVAIAVGKNMMDNGKL